MNLGTMQHWTYLLVALDLGRLWGVDLWVCKEKEWLEQKRLHSALDADQYAKNQPIN